MIQINVRRQVRQQWSSVSIPLWYDSNKAPKNSIPSEGDVSIPLWYDSNFEKELDEETYNDVSIPLWYDSNINYYELLRNNPKIVSIPLWYDSNAPK